MVKARIELVTIFEWADNRTEHYSATDSPNNIFFFKFSFSFEIGVLAILSIARGKVNGWQYICSAPRGLSLLVRNYRLPLTLKLQSSSHELNTPLAVIVYVNRYIHKNSFAFAEIDDSSTIRYLTGIKSARLRSKLEASRVSSHIESLWDNEIVCLSMTIYIYSGAIVFYLSMFD